MRLNATRLGSIASSRSFGDQLYDLAGQVPNLDLNFAGTKTLDPRVTFTRASSATFVDSSGVVQTAATNAPRFDHNPTTGESLGLLVEEARTNLQGNSGVLTAASWATTNVTIATSGTGPDGNTAYEATETTTLGSHAFGGGGAALPSTTSVTSGTVYTGSLFLKKSTVDWVQLLFSSAGFGSTLYINFNLNTGAIGNSAACTGTITPFPNGWYKCTITATATTTTTISNNVLVIFTNNTNTTSRSPSYTGSTSNKMFAAMGQFEVGTFASSYIPTIGSVTATRAADVASITGSNFSSFYNSSAGTVFTEYRDPGSGTTRTPFAISDGTVANRMHLSITGTTTIANRLVASSTTYNPSDLASVLNSRNRYAIAAVVGSCNAASNGTLATASTPAAMPTVSRLNIGANPLTATAELLNGTLARLTYWPVRLANTTLQQITQP
jgi:hypothetical protein